ncbi:hypothetical protein CCM_02576 [Cordyceps militaris CM01]|uniref:Uncharacterized protein n=1 Tax=Cordyceps militaris (strain CM01) TaxID=983644 RepID=G3JAI9_CORMM|nr:uncharacterized protein CCM_02576 [Cordyceps militaris CM01]EGX94305.1 hypothetical protein CCM_02576 [Cordyceps militaris CM01]
MSRDKLSGGVARPQARFRPKFHPWRASQTSLDLQAAEKGSLPEGNTQVDKAYGKRANNVTWPPWHANRTIGAAMAFLQRQLGPSVQSTLQRVETLQDAVSIPCLQPVAVTAKPMAPPASQSVGRPS